MTTPSSSRKFTRHEIMLGAGNLRFDRDLHVGWEIEPSIGIVAKDVMMLALSLQSMKAPLTEAINQVMIPSFQRNFEVSGRPKWPPLAEYTLQVKGELGVPRGDKPLIRSGALRRVMGTVGVWDIGNTSATIRRLPADVWYGAIHQGGYGGFSVFVTAAKRQLGKGASAGAVNKLAFALNDAARGGVGKVSGAAGIPQRQFIMFQEQDIDDIQQVFYEWLVELTIIKGRFAK